MFTLTVLGVSFLVLGAFKFLYSIKAPPSWSTFQRIFITICHFGFRFSNPPVLRVALFFSGITSKSSSKESFFIVSKSALKPSDGVWLHNFKETPLYHLEKTASRLDANGHVIPPPQIHLDAVILHVHGGAFVAGSSRNMVNAHLSLLERIHSQYGKNIAMFSLEYPLAPEYKFPFQLQLLAKTYRWLAVDLGYAGRIILQGESAGGNLILSLLYCLEYNPSILGLENSNTSTTNAISFHTINPPFASILHSPWLDFTTKNISSFIYLDILHPSRLNDYAKLYHHDLSDLSVNPMSALEDICLGGKKRSNGSLSFLSRHHVHGILFLSGTTELFAIQIHAYIELLKQAAVSDEDGNRSRFTHKVIECSTGSVTVKSKWDSHNNNPKNNSENIGESSFEIVHVEGQDMIHDFTLAPKFLFVPQTQVAETEIAYFILEALKKV